MDADEPIIPLPTATEKEVSFLARSGAVVTLRLMDTDRFELKLDTRGDYTAVLQRRGDVFDVLPVSGEHAVRGTDLRPRDLYEGF